MHGALRVGVGQAVADLGDDVHGFGERELGGLAQDVLEVTATHVLHVNDDLAADLVYRVDLDDVRVAQAIQDAGFFEKPVPLVALGGDLFERDLLAEQGVFGEVDDAGRAVPEHVQPLILAQHL